MAKPIKVEELQSLFGDHHNPNRDIFITPTLEGIDKDDQGHGSIGDATMEHVFQQRHRKLELEHYIVTANGNLFRTEFNVSSGESSNQVNHQIVKILASDVNKQPQDLTTKKRRTVSSDNKEAVIQFLKEEIEENKKLRQERLDALDQTIIPFEDWESNPQMSGDIDIPSTPPVMLLYAGNTSQDFYDWIPEDHPDLANINRFITVANQIDWDHWNKSTIKSMTKWIQKTNWVVPTVGFQFIQLCQEILDSTTVHPSKLLISALQNIETSWAKQASLSCMIQFNSGPIAREIHKFRDELRLRKTPGKLLHTEVGRFGMSLFQRYGNQMSTTLWKLYRELKTEFASEVQIAGVDLNRASVLELQRLFKQKFQKQLDDLFDSDIPEEKYQQARQDIYRQINKLVDQIYFNRPYRSLEELAEKNLLTVDDLPYTDKTVVIISMIKKAYKQAKQSNMPSYLGQVAQQIIQYQQSKPDLFTEQDWYNIWGCYRICKTSL